MSAERGEDRGTERKEGKDTRTAGEKNAFTHDPEEWKIQLECGAHEIIPTKKNLRLFITKTGTNYRFKEFGIIR